MGEDHILDTNRSHFIQTITMVKPVLDELKQMKLLTIEQYNCVSCKVTSQEQMRELYSHIQGWGHPAKDKVYEYLQRANPGVMVAILERRPNPVVMTVLERRPKPVYKYGDISAVECSGASSSTAKQNNLIEDGVRASYRLAEEDYTKMLQYKDAIRKVAKRKNMDPAIIAGIISRASRAGDLLHDGWEDDRDTFGLMQICKRFHPLTGEWNSEQHIEQGTNILIDMISQIKRKFPRWSEAQLLKGGIAAYSSGASRVHSYETVDEFTVSQDFSNDVVARAQWFKTHWPQR